MKPDDLVARLASAIDCRREVRLVYGSAVSVRLVWPHALGISDRGNPTLLAWQHGAGTKRSAGWRNFNLAKIEAVVVSSATFEAPAPGYNPDAPGLARVLKSV